MSACGCRVRSFARSGVSISVSPSSRWCATRIRGGFDRLAAALAAAHGERPRDDAGDAAAKRELDRELRDAHRRCCVGERAPEHGFHPVEHRVEPEARQRRTRARRCASRARCRAIGEQRGRSRRRARRHPRAATTCAVSPSRAISGIAPASVVTQGTPANIACSSACGTPSFAYDGSANTSSAASQGATSRCWPANVTRSRRPSAVDLRARARRAAGRRRRSTRRASAMPQARASRRPGSGGPSSCAASRRCRRAARRAAGRARVRASALRDARA